MIAFNFTKFQFESLLFADILKTLARKILILKKILQNVGKNKEFTAFPQN